MKILAIADRPPSNSILKTLDLNPDIELIITLGDLGLIQLSELEFVKNLPKLGVYGNHCSGQYFEQLGIFNLHLKTFEYRGFKFGGFEGSLRYKNSSYGKMYSQIDSQNLLSNFDVVDVLICHSPPFGTNDHQNDLAHTGLVGLRDYVLKYKPKYLFHGHTYPSNPEHKLDQTEIIYIYQDKIVEIN